MCLLAEKGDPYSYFCFLFVKFARPKTSSIIKHFLLSPEKYRPLFQLLVSCVNFLYRIICVSNNLLASFFQIGQITCLKWTTTSSFTISIHFANRGVRCYTSDIDVCICTLTSSPHAFYCPYSKSSFF